MRTETREGVVALTTAFTAVATRGDRYWLVHIPELDQYTQARNLAEVEPMARDLIALLNEIPDDSFHLDVRIELPEHVRHHLELARKYSEDAARARPNPRANAAQQHENSKPGTHSPRHRHSARNFTPARTAALGVNDSRQVDFKP
ncbi:hypothetical protein I552_0577 [Mycobacterium xenopi 3993]|nr:hypothetical protein I552_0577 [Mycobacterium xenopi 3993]